MNPYVVHLEKETEENKTFRTVLFTAHYSQLVVMSLKPGEEIGEETHGLDQFIRVELGEGEVILDGKKHLISDGFAVVVPAGTKHTIINSGKEDLKLYTVYSPPDHKDGLVHATKKDAEHDIPFDGNVTEKN